MIKVTASPGVLHALEQGLKTAAPGVRFAGNVRLGALEIELDRDTAEFVCALIAGLRKRTGEDIRVEAAPSPGGASELTRKFLDGYFEKRR